MAIAPVIACAEGESRLGSVEFPTSAQSSEAQDHFIRGVAALHSFWYPVALKEFRSAAGIEPGFAMAYWGEAMAHNHPVWGDPQETEAARKVLSRLPKTVDVTRREQAYLDAAKALYGEGDKPARDRAYAAAMAELHRAHPDDLEAAAFHSLALLGLAYSGGSDDEGARSDPAAVRTRIRAAAIAQEIQRTSPGHPGAAHYILHAFDDPDHAVLALPSARRYASLAPAAPHALHMPSHIFLPLGMWPKAAASNEASWKASQQAGQPDFHSLHWLLYASLQQGRADQARSLVDTVATMVAQVPRDDVRNRVYGAYTHTMMAATYVVETKQWDSAAALLPAPLPESAADGGQYEAFTALARAPALFARGLAAAMTKPDEARQHATELQEIRQQLAGAPVPFAANVAPVLEIQALEIEAAAHATRGSLPWAIEIAEPPTWKPRCRCRPVPRP